MADHKGIFGLPLEVFDDLMSTLDYESVLAFRQTCRLAASLVPLTTVAQARQALKTTLLARERAEYERRQVAYANQRRWAGVYPQSVQPIAPPQADVVANIISLGSALNNIHRNHITRAEQLNCYSCLKALPRECFVESQVTGRRSLGHHEARRRFCRTCGVTKGIWEKGTVIRDGRCTLVLCKACNNLKTPTPESKNEGMCELCHHEATCEMCQRKPPESLLETAAEPRTAQPSTRATRCQRCWAISHTEVPLGSTGSHLCPGCEAAVSSA
ncbi:hypothetical protein AYL99_09145 [Fonsecaea erecta]|uniref:F-box domain-containing protein n=1 Tax=Fonsecaea erecta TaxID=1367422 RepID=A0A178ZBI9_9EURO|nr:hypothetical protein AYL99_09145 [Fonsecaea erecta]OAP57032.1 hypothetical protein AYL99_09145 [Fonsecaea erecta]